jgi:hypothetical protein
VAEEASGESVRRYGIQKSERHVAGHSGKRSAVSTSTLGGVQEELSCCRGQGESLGHDGGPSACGQDIQNNGKP